jgi:hypothetical protein
MSNPFDNPYEPPVGEYGSDIADPALADEEQIRRRVSRPGTALLIMGSIYSVFPAIYLVRALLALLGNRVLIEEILVTAAFFFTAILIAVGGAKMAFMESYSMARIAAILACIPLISPFVVWGIPFGIWALVVLRDPKVKAAFEAKAQRSLDRKTFLETQRHLSSRQVLFEGIFTFLGW